MRSHLKLILIAMWAVVGLSAAAVGAAAWLMHDRPAAVRFTPPADDSADAPLPVLFPTPPFTLTDEHGQPFSSRQLLGHVWVADFVFTHCTSFCPVMTRSMAEFQRASAADPATVGVRMASFTVDPDRDTPPVLAAYAAANGADLKRWTFLTGTQKQMWDLSTGMKLSVGPGDITLGGSAGMQVMHSSRFLLVDQKGQVRATYDFKDGGYLKALLRDAAKLATEKN